VPAGLEGAAALARFAAAHAVVLTEAAAATLLALGGRQTAYEALGDAQSELEWGGRRF
jgi:hypothetical protein